MNIFVILGHAPGESTEVFGVETDFDKAIKCANGPHGAYAPTDTVEIQVWENGEMKGRYYLISNGERNPEPFDLDHL